MLRGNQKDKKKRQEVTSAGKNLERRKPLYTSVGMLFGIAIKVSKCSFLKKLKRELPYTVGNNLPADARDSGDMASIPGSRRSPEGENVNPLQYSCLNSPMDRGAWRATVRGVARSPTCLSD